jgi:DNA-binding GntR family transcriptional regulator
VANVTTRVLRASGGQLVYAELRRQILNLELAPGTRLYEPELARQLQVSRTPLREAIKLLLAEDLLEQLPTGGVVVPLLSARDIEELYTVRAALESIQAADAARKSTASDLRDLADLVQRNVLLVGYADDAMAIGHSLHARIGVIADNTWATRLHAQVDGHLSRYRKLTNDSQRRRDRALAEHRAIVDAITAHDEVRAAEAARQHVLSARDEALRAKELRDVLSAK